MKILKNFAPIQITNFLSEEISSDPLDLAQTISWSCGLDSTEDKEKVISLLNRDFKKGDQYTVSHEYNVLILKK